MNAAEKLAREISRVTLVREHYEEAGRLTAGRAVVGPQVVMMTKVLEDAFVAAGSNDALQVLAALKDLEEWRD
mgnify:CR=1 FL=1